eukprot:14233277-Heterocapsa_arctica.AAC.1
MPSATAGGEQGFVDEVRVNVELVTGAGVRQSHLILGASTKHEVEVVHRAFDDPGDGDVVRENSASLPSQLLENSEMAEICAPARARWGADEEELNKVMVATEDEFLEEGE